MSNFTVLKTVFSTQTKREAVTHKDDEDWSEESPWK